MQWFRQVFQGQSSPPFRVAQISDCHLLKDHGLYQGIDSTESLIAVLETLAKSHWDLVVVSGDISQDHTPESYQVLAQLMAQYLPDTPIARLPGNHDELESLSAWLSDAPFCTSNHFCFGDWHILQLNSKGPTPAGLIVDEHFKAIHHCLEQIAPAHHIGVFVHHHPLAMQAYIDKHILTNGQALLACLARHPGVKFLAHGHVHQAQQLGYFGSGGEFAVLAAPSTSMQFARHSMVRANEDLGPGFRQFELQPQGQFDSSVVWIR